MEGFFHPLFTDYAAQYLGFYIDPNGLPGGQYNLNPNRFFSVQPLTTVIPLPRPPLPVRPSGGGPKSPTALKAFAGFLQTRHDVSVNSFFNMYVNGSGHAQRRHPCLFSVSLT